MKRIIFLILTLGLGFGLWAQETNSVQPAETGLEDAPVNMKSVPVLPVYRGGDAKFREYIIRELGSIQLRDRSDIRMEFQFIIEKDGKLSNIEILENGGRPDIAERAVDVLGRSPRWVPGKKDGVPVRVMYKIPVYIRVN